MFDLIFGMGISEIHETKGYLKNQYLTFGLDCICGRK
jgi:hypothetical protein